MVLLTLDKLNSSTITKISLLLTGLNLELFFKKILRILRFLLIIFRVSIKKTPNIS